MKSEFKLKIWKTENNFENVNFAAIDKTVKTLRQCFKKTKGITGHGQGPRAAKLK